MSSSGVLSDSRLRFCGLGLLSVSLLAVPWCHGNVVNLLCPCWDTTTALRGLCLETSLQFMVAQPETRVPECRAPVCTSWHDVVAAECLSRREIQKG